MGATAQIHRECRRAAGEALLRKPAHRRALLHGGLTFQLERDRLVVLVDANHASLCSHCRPPGSVYNGRKVRSELQVRVGLFATTVGHITGIEVVLWLGSLVSSWHRLLEAPLGPPHRVHSPLAQREGDDMEKDSGRKAPRQ